MRLEKIKCVISYDGTHFSGFQIQPKQRTVHGELEKALLKMHKGQFIRVYASGRTDAGVHAKAQTIHFETPFSIPGENWKRALNTLLPDDLYVHTAEQATASFHARYDVMEKEYRYFVWNEKEMDVFKRNYTYHFPYRVDMAAIQQACRLLVGEHDFTTLSSAKATTRGSKVRTLYQVTAQKTGSEIEFIFRGNGFLYNMVRIMVGVLLDIGQGRRQASDIVALLEQKDRQLAGETIPPQGLYLWRVAYE